MWKTLFSTQAPLRTWAWRILVTCCGPRTSFSFPGPTSHSFLLRSTSCWRIARHLAKVDVVCKSNLMSCLFALNATERKITHHGITAKLVALKFQRLVVPLFLFVRSQTRIGFAHHDHFGWGMRWSSYGNICNATKLVQTCYLKRVLQLSGVCAGCFCLSAGWSLARFAESESLSCGVQCAWPSQGRSWTATWSVQYLSLHWLSKTLASQSGTSLLHTMGIADPWPGRGARRYQIAKAYTYHITSEYHDMIWYDMKWNDPPIYII